MIERGVLTNRRYSNGTWVLRGIYGVDDSGIKGAGLSAEEAVDNAIIANALDHVAADKFWQATHSALREALAAHQHPDEFKCPLCYDDPANIKQPAQQQGKAFDSAPDRMKPFLAMHGIAPQEFNAFHVGFCCGEDFVKEQPAQHELDECDLAILCQQLKGRAEFLRDRGEVKSPQLMEIVAEHISFQQRKQQSGVQQKPVMYDKTEINCFVQDLYDKKMQEGKRGHYETMFHVVHQAIKKVSQQAQRKPLTVDQIWDSIWGSKEIMASNGTFQMPMSELVAVARAIETAHGITKGN